MQMVRLCGHADVPMLWLRCCGCLHKSMQKAHVLVLLLCACHSMPTAWALFHNLVCSDKHMVAISQRRETSTQLQDLHLKFNLTKQITKINLKKNIKMIDCLIIQSNVI